MAHTDICPTSKWPIPQIRVPIPRVRGWLLLVAWIAAIAVFVLAVGPALLQRSSALQPMAQLIDERGIEANMYFYTEVEVFYEANVNMDNTWDYPHRKASLVRN